MGVDITWAVLAGVLPFFLLKPIRMTSVHWLGIGFLCYAGISIIWTPFPEKGWVYLAQFAILGMVFAVGANSRDSHGVYCGLGIGGTIAGLLALAQWWVFDSSGAETSLFGILQASPPAGLWGNSSILAQTAAIILVITLAERMWWAVPGCTLAVALGGSRAAYVALALVAVMCMPRLWIGVLIGGGLLCLVGYVDMGKASDLRFEIWDELVRHISLFGDGLGSFQYNTSRGFSLHAHNDSLELLYELGIGASLAYLIFLLCIESGNATERAALFTFATIATFAFPLYLSPSGFMAAYVAGSAAGRRAVVQPFGSVARYAKMELA